MHPCAVSTPDSSSSPVLLHLGPFLWGKGAVDFGGGGAPRRAREPRGGARPPLWLSPPRGPDIKDFSWWLRFVVGLTSLEPSPLRQSPLLRCLRLAVICLDVYRSDECRGIPREYATVRQAWLPLLRESRLAGLRVLQSAHRPGDLRARPESRRRWRRAERSELSVTLHQARHSLDRAQVPRPLHLQLPLGPKGIKGC